MNKGIFAVRRLARRSGTAAVASIEFGLMLPPFATLFLGIADFSFAYHDQMQLSSAMAASAQYAFTQGQTETGSTLTSDVQNFAIAVSAVPLTTSTVTVSYNNGLSGACYCVSSSGTYTSTTCGATCGDGSTSGKFLSISANFTYSPMFTPDKVFFGNPISQSVTVRLQ